ncbi:J domain-containing protein [Aestuariivirga sp.]|jgi:DnaJ-domain-containing protein 1|uniref:J domain-containing protein n=1 Tax=Aestuariivirga sp. TaxID=2650926 RepID=UPI00378513AE
MFQSRDDKANRTLALVTLDDDSTLTVSVRMPLSNRLGDALNNADQFLDALTVGGQQIYISKSSIRSVRSAALPKTDQLDLDGRGQLMPGFDPYAVLKVQKGASADEIKQAYHKMARLYHPDRIASYELPEEVKDYVRAMLVRINLAFEQISQ